MTERWWSGNWTWESGESLTEEDHPHNKQQRRSSLFQRGFRRSQQQRETVNGYELLGKIGSGAFATVEKCRKNNEIYAVKIMEKAVLAKKKHFAPPPGNKRGPPTTALEKVQAEIGIMERLAKHPNVVALKESCVDADRIFAFMEFVDGGPVMDFDEQRREFSWQHQGPCPIPTALRYLADVASGLSFMHSHHIAHRDLKPANILLCNETNRCKLSDFGVAKHFHFEDDDHPTKMDDDDQNNVSRLRLVEKLQRSQSRYLVQGTEGTYAYFAPEMLTSLPFNALACDLWALGVCLFNFLTAKLPFDNEFTDDLFDAIAKADPDYDAFPVFFFQQHPSSSPESPDDDDDQSQQQNLSSETTTTTKDDDDDKSGGDEKHLRDLVASLLNPDPATRASLHDVLHHPLVTNHRLHHRSADDADIGTKPKAPQKLRRKSLSIFRRGRKPLLS